VKGEWIYVIAKIRTTYSISFKIWLIMKKKEGQKGNRYLTSKLKQISALNVWAKKGDDLPSKFALQFYDFKIAKGTNYNLLHDISL